jgi:hypothetical protein
MLASVRGFKLNDDKFTVAPHGDDAAAGKLQFERGRIIDEICLAQAHVQDPPARQHRSQTSNDRFDFRQLRHLSILRRRKQRENANRPTGAAFEFYRRCDQKRSRFRQLIEIREIFQIVEPAGRST